MCVLQTTSIVPIFSLYGNLITSPCQNNLIYLLNLFLLGNDMIVRYREILIRGYIFILCAYSPSFLHASLSPSLCFFPSGVHWGECDGGMHPPFMHPPCFPNPYHVPSWTHILPWITNNLQGQCSVSFLFISWFVDCWIILPLNYIKN